MATGYDPLLDNEPDWPAPWQPLSSSVSPWGTSRREVARIGSGFGYEGEGAELKGPRCVSANGFSLHANTAIPAHRRVQLERLIRIPEEAPYRLSGLRRTSMGIWCTSLPGRGPTAPPASSFHRWSFWSNWLPLVPLPRAHLVRYGGCLAPHSKLRAVIIPSLRHQGVNDRETKTGTPYWHWARLLGRVFDLEMATCLPPLCGRREARRRAGRRSRARPCDLPFCRRGSLRIIAVITQESVIDPHPASPSAGVRPPSHCPCPLSPGDIRVRRSPRQCGIVGDGRAATASLLPWRLDHIPFAIAPSEGPALQCHLAFPSRAFPNQPSRGPHPWEPQLEPHPSWAACPDRVLPCATPCFELLW